MVVLQIGREKQEEVGFGGDEEYSTMAEHFLKREILLEKDKFGNAIKLVWDSRLLNKLLMKIRRITGNYYSPGLLTRSDEEMEDTVKNIVVLSLINPDLLCYCSSTIASFGHSFILGIQSELLLPNHHGGMVIYPHS
ncbi:hypothetical protein MKX03_029589 [Papaver bracteatum]|nr:hypothetical protein MKX03_029589 [Papaver bracteatum]